MSSGDEAINSLRSPCTTGSQHPAGVGGTIPQQVCSAIRAAWFLRHFLNPVLLMLVEPELEPHNNQWICC